MFYLVIVCIGVIGCCFEVLVIDGWKNVVEVLVDLLVSLIREADSRVGILNKLVM